MGMGAVRGTFVAFAHLASSDLAKDATHDLTRARLRECRRPVHHVGRSEGTDLRAALHLELREQLIGRLDALVERRVDVDALALDWVREADDGSLGDVGVQHDRGLDLRGTNAMAADTRKGKAGRGESDKNAQSGRAHLLADGCRMAQANLVLITSSTRPVIQ